MKQSGDKDVGRQLVNTFVALANLGQMGSLGSVRNVITARYQMSFT